MSTHKRVARAYIRKVAGKSHPMDIEITDRHFKSTMKMRDRYNTMGGGVARFRNSFPLYRIVDQNEMAVIARDGVIRGGRFSIDMEREHGASWGGDRSEVIQFGIRWKSSKRLEGRLFLLEIDARGKDFFHLTFFKEYLKDDPFAGDQRRFKIPSSQCSVGLGCSLPKVSVQDVRSIHEVAADKVVALPIPDVLREFTQSGVEWREGDNYTAALLARGMAEETGHSARDILNRLMQMNAALPEWKRIGTSWSELAEELRQKLPPASGFDLTEIADDFAYNWLGGKNFFMVDPTYVKVHAFWKAMPSRQEETVDGPGDLVAEGYHQISTSDEYQSLMKDELMPGNMLEVAVISRRRTDWYGDGEIETVISRHKFFEIPQSADYKMSLVGPGQYRTA